MLAAVDMHNAVFQAAVLDGGDGEITEERFEASREALVAWIGNGRVSLTSWRSRRRPVGVGSRESCRRAVSRSD